MDGPTQGGEPMKPCLRCGRSLDDATLDGRHLLLTCTCGVVYSAELVERTFDDETWQRMFAEDGYTIHDDGGETLTVKVSA